MAGYAARASTYTNGDTVEAADTNDEYTVLVSAFDASSGHKHDGTAGEGATIDLLSDDSGDTAIEVERTPSSDVIYFTAGGNADVLKINSSSLVINDDGDVFNVRIEGDTDGNLFYTDATNDRIGVGTATPSVLFDVAGAAKALSLALTSGATITAILDEDAMGTDSATAVATQQSIKAYVDAATAAHDLDFQGDSGGALAIILASETMVIAGGTGIDTSGATNTLTIDIDSTVTTLTGSQTLTNKTLTAPIISGGTIDNAVIGGVTPAAADFTTMDTTGNASVGGTLIVTGDLTVNGTTTTVNSTTVTHEDVVLTLGGATPPAVDDNKDRGIEFNWHNGSAAKVGFFGYDDSASAFTFVLDATNTSEVFSGTAGDVIFNDATLNSLVLTTDLPITEGGTGSSTASDARTALGLAIGVDVMAYDATMLVDADIGVSVQAYDATILVDADIGVNVQAYDATILVDADIGVNVQAYDATIVVDADIGVNVQAFGAVLDDLNTLGANAADSEFLVGTGAGALTWETGATARTSLGVAIGSDVQAYDVDTLKADVSDTLTVGMLGTSHSLGTLSTATTLHISDGNIQHATMGGSFTLTAPDDTDDGYCEVEFTIDGTGGYTLTLTGFNEISGAIDTTASVVNTLRVSKLNTNTYLEITQAV